MREEFNKLIHFVRSYNPEVPENVWLVRKKNALSREVTHSLEAAFGLRGDLRVSCSLVNGGIQFDIGHYAACQYSLIAYAKAIYQQGEWLFDEDNDGHFRGLANQIWDPNPNKTGKLSNYEDYFERYSGNITKQIKQVSVILGEGHEGITCFNGVRLHAEVLNEMQVLDWLLKEPSLSSSEIYQRLIIDYYSTFWFTKRLRYQGQQVVGRFNYHDQKRPIVLSHKRFVGKMIGHGGSTIRHMAKTLGFDRIEVVAT